MPKVRTRHDNNKPKNFWKPEPFWQGQDVFIYGGGTSLNPFDPDILINENVIGCNDAYTFGPKICNICVFGDHKWYKKHLQALHEDYVKQGGIVVTNEPKVCSRDGHPWLKKMPRQSEGLSKVALGWNCNTGAVALNLALILGAANVYLLGFDMQLGTNGHSNWHPNLLDRPKESVYERMLKCFKVVAEQLPKVFPNQNVFNVNDCTALRDFPIIRFDEFWEQREMLHNNVVKEAS